MQPIKINKHTTEIQYTDLQNVRRIASELQRTRLWGLSKAHAIRIGGSELLLGARLLQHFIHAHALHAVPGRQGLVDGCPRW